MSFVNSGGAKNPAKEAKFKAHKNIFKATKFEYKHNCIINNISYNSNSECEQLQEITIIQRKHNIINNIMQLIKNYN